MPMHKAPNVEPIRGYRLIEPLGKGGFGEVWKCEAPGGIFKAVKFVYGDLHGQQDQRFRAEEELRAFQLIKSIRHPFLLSIDRVENVDGELLIITELADCNLHDLRLKFQALGQRGIPRGDLLAYLREAAEVLDLMNRKFDLQHLDIKPRNLFLVSNHVKVADFGLVNRLTAKDADVQASAITPLFAAPELFAGKMSRQCDQYSLAIVYQELLTGTLPFTGEHSRQLMMLHLQGTPDVSALPEADQAVILKALSKNPDDRFASCLDFLRALDADVAPRSQGESALNVALGGHSTETVQTRSVDTTNFRRGPSRGPVAPPILQVVPGLSIGECVSTGPLQDTWRARDVNDNQRLVKIIYGLSRDAAKVREAVLQLKSIHHPALMIHEVVHVEPGRLVLTTDGVKETLRDRFQECQERKQPGIVRGELMEYLRAAAEVLDYLFQQYGLHHWNLHPRQLVLDHGWLQLAEFGLTQLIWLPGGQNVAERNVRYAAPEQLEGAPHRSSDQYTLALIFAEMLSGIHPFHGKGYPARRQLTPDLERLPVVDREVLTRALHLDPQQRWPSCTAMMLALEGTSLECLHELEKKEDHFAQLIAESKHADAVPSAAGVANGNLNLLIQEIIAKSGGDTLNGDTQIAPAFHDDWIEHRFQIGLPIGSARNRLQGFPQPWFGQVMRDDDQGLIFRISLPTTFWRQLFGKQAGLEVQIRLSRVNPRAATPVEVVTTVQPLRKQHAASRELLDELGPQIIASLQQLLMSDADKRIQDRLLWPNPLKVTPILADGTHDEPIQCRGKDISRSGIGFYLPHDLATSEVLIELPNDIHPPSIAIPATLVRAKRCADGWYEVGALYRIPALRKSNPDFSLPSLELAGSPRA